MITIPTSNRAEKPKGAPFYVDRVSFRPGERVDVARFTLADDKVFDWAHGSTSLQTRTLRMLARQPASRLA